MTYQEWIEVGRPAGDPDWAEPKCVAESFEREIEELVASGQDGPDYAEIWAGRAYEVLIALRDALAKPGPMGANVLAEIANWPVDINDLCSEYEDMNAPDDRDLGDIAPGCGVDGWQTGPVRASWGLR